MNGHPGGDAHTMRMIELCALSPGARVLDMGAGELERALEADEDEEESGEDDT